MEQMTVDSTSPARRWLLRGDFVLRCVLAIALGVAVCLGLSSWSQVLPDYEAYLRIFDIGARNFSEGVNGYAFFGFVQVAQALHLSYDEFRYLLALVSALTLCVAVFSVSRSARAAGAMGRRSFSHVALIATFAMVPVLVFGIEFYQVRIRGGLALSLYSLAFSLCFANWKTLDLLRKVLIVGLTVSALSVHAFTAVVLTYFLYFPFIFDGNQRRNVLLQLGLCGAGFIVAVLFLYVACSGAGELRGEDLKSPLNFARFIAIGVIPIAIYISCAIYKLRGRGRTPPTRRVAGGLGPSKAHNRRRIGNWLNGAAYCYFSLALALVLLHCAGMTLEAGEAIVRIFTLSSVPAVFSLAMQAPSYLSFWCFLLTVNSAFFANTISYAF